MKLEGKEKEIMTQIIEQTFRGEKLVARDDVTRYSSVKQEEMAASNSAGGDSTFKLKNTYKSLKTLAGNNDSIFAILDDRADFWFDENTGRAPKNLLKLPAYFFHDQVFHHVQQQGGLSMLHFDLSRSFELDPTLLTYSLFLQRVHH